MGVCGQYVLMQTLFMNRIEDFMKKIFRQIHLWLSVPFGLIISLICFSGAMLVFENEVMELVRHELYYVKKVEAVSLPVDRLLEEVELMLPDSVSVTGINVFSDPERAWQVNLSKPRRAFMYVDQYTGEIKGKYERPAFFCDYVQAASLAVGQYESGWRSLLGKNDCRCQHPVVCRGFDIGYRYLVASYTKSLEK